MRAVTVLPQKANGLELSDVPEPTQADGDVLVDVLAVGICGTDAEIIAGEYGEAPPGHDRLVLGHESLGRAGPVGLLAALLGVQRGLEVHVLDQVTGGPKPDLVRDLGASYHCDGIENLGVTPDIAVECTGVAPVVLGSIEVVRPNGITCLTGVSSPGRTKQVDLGGLNRALVLENNLVFGSVNANRSHWEAAARALADADRGWLERLITRRVPLGEMTRAFQRGADDVKVVLEIGDLP